LLCEALPQSNNVAWCPVDGPLEYVLEAPVFLLSADLSPPVPPPKLPGGAAV
jgi:hypothetical protein